MPVNHAFQSLVAPSDDVTLVRPPQWNENHVVDVDLATEVHGVLGVANGGLNGATTSDLPEGSNLYYTSARFDTDFSGKTTSNLPEGSNLYYTAARFNAAFAAKTTTDLAEGTNLYYTPERVDDRVAALLQEGSNIDLTYNDGADTLTVATVTTPTFSYITTNVGTLAEGANHHVFATTGNVARFGIGLIDNESGSNTGSNMLFFTYADNGAYLANAIGFRRSDGAITTGNWQATRIGLAYGGTNANLSATGGAGQYLKQSSTGAAVTVGTIPASDIASGAALTKTDDTNVTLTLGGSPSTALLAATSLTLGWTGQLSAGRGGTGIASYAVGDLLYASGATTLSKLAGVATGNALISGGVTTAPSWGKIGLTTHVSGTLPWTNGGTNNNSGFTTNSVIFSDGTKLTESNAGLNFNPSTLTLSVQGTIQNSTLVNGEVSIRCLNASSGSSAYSIYRLGNDTANNFVTFLNSSTRTADGGANAATIRNDAGILRLQSSSQSGITINASTIVLDHNLGIGAAPSGERAFFYKPSGDCVASVTSGSYATWMGVNSAGYSYMGSYTNNVLLLITNNVNRIAIDTSGYIYHQGIQTVQANDSVDTSAPNFKTRKSRAGGSVNVNDYCGAWEASFYNSAAAEKTAFLISNQVNNKTAGSENIYTYFQQLCNTGSFTNVMQFANTGDVLVYNNFMVGSGSTPNAAAVAEFQSTTRGVLMPRMTTTQRDAISSPPDGLIIYNTSTNKFQGRAGSAWADLN